MPKYQVVIIGGGLGGLTAGALLAKAGYKILLLEQHYVPGGCATTFKRRNFLMEAGLHEMDGLFERDLKTRIFRQLGIDKYIHFSTAPELFHLVAGQQEFTFPHDEPAAREALNARFPDEVTAISRFFRLINGVHNEMNRFPQTKWKRTLLYPLTPLLYPAIWKASRLTCGEWLNKNIRNEELKRVLMASYFYYGDDPGSMSLLYYSFAQASYIRGGGHFIKGGSQQLSDYLASIINGHGGQVLLGKKAVRIIMEGNKAAGVQYMDAFNTATGVQTVYAQAIVVNAAIPLIAGMLPSTQRPLLNAITQRFKPACSLLSVYMGFKTDLRSCGVTFYSTIFEAEGVQKLEDIHASNKSGWDKRGFVFVSYSQLDSGLAPRGKSTAVICAVDYLSEWEGLSENQYRQKKEQVALQLFKRLEAYYPGIMQHLVCYEVGTPATIQRFTGNPAGTPYGFAQTPAQSGMNRVPVQSPIPNMFFASAWSFPGGGFSGAILGGHQAFTAVKNKIRKKESNNTKIRDYRVVKLLHKKIIADSTLELTFDKPAGFQHQPGQYAVLRLNQPLHGKSDIPVRSLSVVSSPEENTLRFAMRISDSPFKEACLKMKENEPVTLFGPMGKFGIRPTSSSIVFLAGGIGITPVLPLLRQLEKSKFNGNVYLFYSCRKEEQMAYVEEIQKLRLTWFLYSPVITSQEKRINGQKLRYVLKTLPGRDFYITGSAGFLSSMRRILLQEGVPETALITDDFG